MRLFHKLKKLSRPSKRKLALIIRSLIFLCLDFAVFSAAFSAQYRFENWSTEQGLPYKTVRGVLQTRDGYIWAATSDGLARFDGVRFTVFNTANSPGLTKNRLEFLAETLDGSLWISGEEGFLFRFYNGVFSSYSTAEGLPSNIIQSIYADQTENRLIVLTALGIAVWQDGKIVSVEPMNVTAHRYDTLLDNTGAFCRKEGDVVYRRTSNGVIEYKLPGDLHQTVLAEVYEDRAGTVWIGTFHLPTPGKSKLYRFKGNEVSVFDERDGLPNAFIGQILQDRQGNIWVASGKFDVGGLAKFENGKLRLFTKEDGFVGIGVLGLVEDREGALWAAISDNGLTRVTPQFITSLTMENSGLTSNNIYPLYEDREGAIWAGAWRYGSQRVGGVDKFENGRFKNFADEDKLTSLAPNSVFKDREGVLWLGAIGGLTRVKDGKFIKYSRTNGFAHGSVNAIIQTRDGSVWLATEEGLTRFRDEQFTEFTVADGLPHPDLRNLFEARDGTLWIASMGGLGSYRDGQFTKWSDKIPAVQFRSIYEDADGTLWFGSYDAGIFRYQNGEFKAITIQNGLFDNGAFQILEDDFGRFWISSNRGIYRVARRELNDFTDGKIRSVTSIGYGVKDGMADAECNGGRSPAGFKSKKDGTLWFPTQKGIAVVNPNALPIDSQPPGVAIENCLIDGKEADCGNIRLLPENESLEINYTGLSFNRPEQINFKYTLEGLNENWVDAGRRRRAYFTHLPPGEYAFKVSAANAEGVWNETGASLKITVTPPFYQTFWFGVVCVLIIGGILFFGYRRRIDNLEAKRAAQEEFSRQLMQSQERERQRIAAELHDGLGQDLLIIKNWAMLGLKNGADSSSQLGEISETASAAIDEVREIAYNLRPFHLDELGLTKAVESMLDRVSKVSTIEFSWKMDSVDGFFPREAEINFYRIVQECVNNIVKHSGAKSARVEIDRDESGLRLSIEDDGKGFDTVSMASKRANQSGFGLAGINERVRILGGKLVVGSILGEGTSVKITFL